MFGEKGPLAGVTQSVIKGVTGATGFLGKAVSSIFGNVVGSLLPGLGGLISSGLGALVKALNIGGPSKEQLAARNVQADMVKQLQATATEAQKAEGALTDTYHTIAIVGRDAFLAVGLSAEDTDKKIQDLLNTSDVARFNAAKAALELAGKAAADIATKVGQVTTAFGTLGARMPESTKATIAALLQMKGLTDAERQSLGALLAQAVPDYAKLTESAAKYGITLDALGPKFQQANIDATAKDINNTFDGLREASGDVGGILLGMSDEISKLVTDSQKFGAAIPDNMKPLIENLIAAGKLVDENGKAITDITGIKFEATPLDQGLKKLNDTLVELTDTLENLPRLMAGLPPVHIKAWLDLQNAPGGTAPPTPPGQNTGPEAGVYQSTGGIIGRSAQYFGTGGVAGFPGGPRGADRYPVWAAADEMFLTVSQQRAIGALINRAPTAARASSSGAPTITLQGPLVGTVILPAGTDPADQFAISKALTAALRDNTNFITTRVGEVAVRAVEKVA